MNRRAFLAALATVGVASTKSYFDLGAVEQTFWAEHNGVWLRAGDIITLDGVYLVNPITGRELPHLKENLQDFMVTSDVVANDRGRLELTPRPNTQTGRTYRRLDFWVARTGDQAGLPVKVMAGKKDGTGAVNSYITITFSKIELNSGFSGSVFKIDVPRGFKLNDL